VNNLKFGVLLCGLAGIVGVFLPQAEMHGHTISLWDAHSQPSEAGGGIHVYLIIAAYGVAFLMGLLAVLKPPMMRIHSLVALVAFGFVLLKMRDALPFDVFKGEIGSKLLGGAAYAGALVSLLSMFKPETSR
jgi:hypothetical protein